MMKIKDEKIKSHGVLMPQASNIYRKQGPMQNCDPVRVE